MVSTIGENKKCSKPPTRLYIYIFCQSLISFSVPAWRHLEPLEKTLNLCSRKRWIALDHPRYHARYVRFLAPCKFEIDHPIPFLSFHHKRYIIFQCSRPFVSFDTSTKRVLALPTSTHLSSKKIQKVWPSLKIGHPLNPIVYLINVYQSRGLTTWF